MTKLNDMKDAPRDGTEILVMYDDNLKKYWDIVKYIENDESSFEEWTTMNQERTYYVFVLAGWLPLPEITEDIKGI